MTEVPSSGFKKRNFRTESRRSALRQTRFFFGMYPGSKIQKKDRSCRSNQPWPHMSLSKLCDRARHAQIAVLQHKP